MTDAAAADGAATVEEGDDVDWRTRQKALEKAELMNLTRNLVNSVQVRA